MCIFPTNRECLIGISDGFSAFCLRVFVILPTCSLYPQQKRAYSALPVGTYRVQSPGFPKIVYYWQYSGWRRNWRCCKRMLGVGEICYTSIPEADAVRAQELCESRGDRPGLPVSVDVPNSPYGLCGRKATLNVEADVVRVQFTELGSWRGQSSVEADVVRVQFCSVQFKMVSIRLEKPICAPPPSLRSFPNFAFETVPVFVWLTMALACPSKEDHLASFNASLLQAVSGVMSLALCSQVT